MTEPDATGPSFALSVSSSNFQQCANGDNGGEPCVYINGVLNDSKSLYRESDVIAERFVIPGLTVGHTYRLVFDYGWEKAVDPGHMNYDFIAGWNSTLSLLANPCGDPLGNPSADIRAVCNIDHTVKSTHTGANAAFQVIPDAIFTTNAPLGLSTEIGAAIDRFQTTNGADAVRVDILGGSFPAGAFDNVTYTVGGDDVTGRLTVRFVAGQTTVMLLWGGHFADSRDYRLALWDDDKNAATPQHTGNLTGAAGQSGAPFHFTQQYLKNLVSGDSTGIGALSNNVQGSVLEPLPKASITIAPSATNGIGESHTFTVTLMKDLDDGSGPIPAASEHVSVTLTAAGGSSTQLNAAASTCDNAGANTDSNGQCTMVFTSNTAGTVTGSATATLSLNGTSVTVTTDGSGDNSAAAVKTFVAGTLKWLKHDGNTQLLGGAVFTVCRTQVWNSSLNNGAGGYTDITPDVCVDVTDNVSGTDNTGSGDRDGTAGEFEIGGLILGKYTVTEKTAPAGYTLDSDTENADLSTTTPSVTIATAFVNIPPPQLSITKTPDLATDDGGTVHPGDQASFTITVSNSAAAGTANAVVMTDTLPAGLSWTDNQNACVIDQVTVNSVSRDRVICTIGSLAPGASFSVIVTTTIPNNFTQLPPSPAGSPLEIDGNLVDDAAAGKDWASLSSSVFSCTSNPKIGCDIDRPTGRTDNSFGQGTKEDTPVPKVVSGSIPNNKSDLLRFYVANERFVTTDYLYLAWSRVQEPSGTTNMDFELNQSNVLSANGVTPVRTAGDILIRYDLSQGGTNPVLGFHRWITSGSASLCEASNAVPCWDKKKDLTTDVLAAINPGAVSEPIAGGSLSARTFGEARINLQASGIFPSGQCTVFGKAYLKSRSSDAFTSEVKDFIAPIPVDITNCAPVTLNNRAWAKATNFAPTGGNLGDPISDTGKIEVTDNTSASLNVDRTFVRLAEASVGGEATTGLVVALDVLDVDGRSPLRGAAADDRPTTTLAMGGRQPRPGPDAISILVT
ncbi:MAG: SpaA isopeptide-forming pilin-related protein [Gemmatimonadales bacterium]